MKYALLIYMDDSQMSGMSEAEHQEALKQWFSYSDELQKSGKMLGGHALQPTPTAKTAWVRNGMNAVTDGPFAETKEQFGGFYLIEAENEDEAAKWALKMPHIESGSVEIRPVREFNQARCQVAQRVAGRGTGNKNKNGL